MTDAAEIRSDRQWTAATILRQAQALEYTAAHGLTNNMREDLTAAVETIQAMLAAEPYVAPIEDGNDQATQAA